ncbi:MAG: MFS transporter, partial [Rhodospirillales bacterium]|nr:MFS transporter [Rhodospirillales bacterium]
PRYYMAEYGLELTMAAFISLIFTLPSGVIRALDRWGGDTVTWWVFWVSIVCLFFLSYPSTTFTVHGIEGDIAFDIRVDVVLFTVLVFIVGVAQGIGKASVYRSLADHYSGNMGGVGGLVGVIGGLGGFTLPIMFGIAADATGVRSSTFMLMYAVLGGVMIWTWLAAKGEGVAILEKDPALLDKLVEQGFRVSRRWLRDWRPDDETFWQETGRRIALRNLIFSMPPLLLSFAVWIVWSVVVVELPRVGFQFTTGELFWLAGAPGLSGAALRLAYSFVVPIFGGRNWTVFSTASLVVPTLWMALAVQDPGTDYVVFVVIALLCGLGGGNLSASMANISFFFPKRMQGTALGWNAGVGNLGIGIAQAVVPLVIFAGALSIKGGEAQTYVDRGVTSEVWLQNAGFVWIPLILAATVAAAWGMNNIRGARATFGEQVAIFRRKHAWLLAWLYTGTLGSFIGFAAVFPTLLSALFPESGAAKWAFIGPIAGALVRPLGGWLSDRLGGARVTLWNFAVMLVAAFAALIFLPSGSGDNELAWFLAAFMLLFIATGIGNGSVYRVVPTVFLTLHQRWAEGEDQVAQDAAIPTSEIESAVALGFTASVAALGLFFIPAMIAISIETTGTIRIALIVFVIFYATCMFTTWWWYRRDGAEVRCD